MHTTTPAKITEKIVSVKLSESAPVPLQSLHEKMKRPKKLPATAYQLRTPLANSSVYILVSDIVLNEGTANESRRPFEIFINSKEMENFQWIVALTRMLSAVFRKGGDVAFVVEELKEVFDPRGGYLSKSGYIPSLVAEIGMVLEEHFTMLGIIKKDDSLTKAIEEKKAQHLAKGGSINGATCPKCGSPTLVPLDGCPTCLTCGHSKCG